MGRLFIGSWLPQFFIIISLWSLIQSSSSRSRRIKENYNLFSPPPLSQLSPEVINILSLGHKEIYDDFINIWLLQALLDDRKGTQAEPMIKLIRSVIKHQPKLESLYMLSCFVLFQDFKQPQFCQEIILAGLKAFPESWRLPMTQGFVEYFLMKQPAQAASFFLMAASRPRSPIYVQKTVEKILSSQNLAADDLAKSLEILSESDHHQNFIRLLQGFGKLGKNPSLNEENEKINGGEIGKDSNFRD